MPDADACKAVYGMPYDEVESEIPEGNDAGPEGRMHASHKH